MNKKLLSVLAVIPFAGTCQWTDVTSFGQVISDLKSYNNQLHIVGGFTNHSGSTCYWSSYYDGNNFYDHSSLIGGSGLSRLEVFGTDLYATGSLNISSSMGVYTWDGFSWNSGGFFNTSHTGLFADGNDLYIGSDFGVVSKKTGTTGSWTSLPAFSSNDDIGCFAKYNGEIIIGGSFASFQGTTLNNIAKWNGTTWQPLGTGLNGTVRALAVFNNELYAAGSFLTAGGTAAKYIAKWNGTSWASVAGSVTGTGYNGMRDMIVYNNKLYVTGDFLGIGGINAKYVAQWNGSSWQAIDLTPSSSYGNCIEVYNGKLYVGTFNFNDAHLYSIDLLSIGIDEKDISDKFSLSPNPATNELFISRSSDNNFVSEIMQLKVFDLQGKRIDAKTLSGNQLSLDISLYEAGMYIIEIYAPESGRIARKKFTKSL